MTQEPLLQSEMSSSASSSSSSSQHLVKVPNNHNIVWRFFTHIPIFSSLLWLMDSKHACGQSPVVPQAAALAETLGKRYFRSNTTNLLIHYRTWHPAATSTSTTIPKGVVYIVHGYGEHCGRYEHVGAALAAAGYLVFALDHQGCGGSEGDKAYVEKFQHYVADILQLCQQIQPPPSSSVPAFLLGHSMGALMSLHVAHASPPSFWKGVILSGAGLVFDPKVDTAVNRFLAKTLANIVPKLEVQPLDVNTICSDKAVVVQYTRDPLVYHGALRVRVGFEVINAVNQVHQWVSSLSVPTLILHGENDILCNPAGSKWLFANATGIQDKSLELFPGLFHEIFNEASGPMIIQKVRKWIDAHLNEEAGGGGDAGGEGGAEAEGEEGKKSK